MCMRKGEGEKTWISILSASFGFDILRHKAFFYIYIGGTILSHFTKNFTLNHVKLVMEHFPQQISSQYV